MSKHYKLKKEQLYMVKNAKMFKERFEEVKRDIQNKFKEINTRLIATKPSDDTIAQLILKEIIPLRELRELVDSNLNSHRYNSKINLEDVLLKVYPEKAKKIRSTLIAQNKGLVTKNEKNTKRLKLLYTELKDKVIFNGLDPLEAIKQLQAFKEE
jgi:hypothetical protein